MKSKKKVFLLLLFLLLLAVFTGYLFLAYYYRNGFSLNTWINGVYCTGKTVEEVNTELLAGVKAPVITITDREGKQELLNFELLGYEEDFRPALKEYQNSQNSYLWIDNVLFHKAHTLLPFVSVDREALYEEWNRLSFVKTENSRSIEYVLQETENGYALFDGLSHRLDSEKAFQALQEVLASGQKELFLEEAGCYYDLPFSKEAEQTKRLWEKIQEFQNCNLVYDMGDEFVPLNSGIMAGFLKKENGLPILDENGKLVPEEKNVRAFVDDLADAYDTFGKERSFQATRGELISVRGGTYGTRLNRKAETDYLMKNLLLDEIRFGEKQLHIPKYEKQGVCRGKNDIGTTYIEVDMKEQKMYYYEEGELILETEVVTGNTSRRMGTPSGVNYVYAKQKDRTLRGPGYATPVKFWMPVKGGIGIHDARWRDKFGGEIYKKNGSHGCINTPLDKMRELYEMVEIGTPVIMFY